MNEPDSNAPETLDLRSYMEPIWRRKWLVLLVTAIAAAGTYLVSSSRAETYTATTQVYIENVNPAQAIGTGVAPGPATSQQLEDIAKLFTAESVATQVSKALGVPVDSVGAVDVTPQAGSSFISVTGESHSPALAAKLANTYVSVFFHTRSNQVKNRAKGARLAAQSALATLPGDVDDPNAAAQRQTLLAQISELQSIELNHSAGARQIDRAEAPTTPSSPKPVRDATFGAAVGLMLGMLLALGLNLLNTRLLSVTAIERILKLPVLTVLPHVDDAKPAVDGHPAMAPGFIEAMRTLRVNLRLASRERPARTTLVTSSMPGEGKSTVARALALAYAEAGERVLVIDADLRRPGMETAFGVEAETGLAHLLRSGTPLSEAVVTAPTSMMGGVSMNGAGHSETPDGSPAGSIDILTHGEHVQDPVTLLSSPAMGTLLSAASASYDAVILDTPPLLAVSDAVPLLELVDMAMLVVRLGQATRNSADRGAEIVERIPGINLVGVVVNDMRRSYAGDNYGSYGYYRYDEAKPKVGA